MNFDDYAAVCRTLDDYNRCHDARLSDEWIDLFAPDATFTVHGHAYVGHAELRDFLASRRPGAGKHLSGVPIIVESDADTCRVEADYIGFRRPSDSVTVGGTGRYFDRLRRFPDRWRFTERVIVGAEGFETKAG